MLAIVAWVIKTQISSDPAPDPGGPTGRQPPRDPPPPTQSEITPPAPRGGGPQGGGGGGSAGGPAPTTTASPALRRGFDLPAAGAAYVPNEVILDIAATVPTQTLDAIAARHAMTRLETHDLPSHRPHAASLAHRRRQLGAGHDPQHRGRTPGGGRWPQLHLSVGASSRPGR